VIYCRAAHFIPYFSRVDFATTFWYHSTMQRKHRRTLEAIFDQPDRSNIPWQDIESLFSALGAEILEGRGSRVRVALNGVRAVFHRPHPQKEAHKGAVRAVRRFLKEAGVTP